MQYAPESVIQQVWLSSEPAEEFLRWSLYTESEPNGVYCRGSHINPKCLLQCHEPRVIFGSLEDSYLFWHCALLPVVSNAFQAGELSSEDVALLTESEVDLSLQYARSITLTVASCLSAYCEGQERCKRENSPACTVPLLGNSSNSTSLNLDNIDSCLDSICSEGSLYPKADSDIAGIGIMIAYIMQVSVAVLAGLALFCLQILARRRRHNKPTDSVPPPTEEERDDQKSETTASSTIASDPYSRVDRLFDAILATLVEFHKTQCFLCLAITIASILIFSTGLSIIDRSTLSMAGGLGILPVTLTQYLLATFNSTRKPWFLFGLTLICCIPAFYVAMGPETAGRAYDTAQDSNYVFDDRYPNACGNASPQLICSRQPVSKVEVSIYGYLYAFCAPVLAGLSIWQLTSITRFRGLISRFSVKSVSQRWKKAWWSIMHIGALAFMCAPLVGFFYAIDILFSRQAVGTEWIFGQVVAVAVWLPTLAAGINNWMHGIARANTELLPASHHTTRSLPNRPRHQI